MRFETILTIIAGVAVVAGGAYVLQDTPTVAQSRLLTTPSIPAPAYDAWVHWQQKHKRSYGTNSEQDYRMKVWYSNYQKVSDNVIAKKSYELELNNFADLTSEEFVAAYTGYNHVPSTEPKVNGFTFWAGNLPESVDWRKTAVTPVKNQGQCGSCWAFSTTGAVEGMLGTSGKKLTPLSEQQLVDCAGATYGNNGCKGGLMDNGFTYLQKFGIESETDYPYAARDGTCTYDAKKEVTKVGKFVDVAVNSAAGLKAALAQQPVSVAIMADQIQLYKKGVFTDYCGTTLDHGVLAVGYGEEDGKKYWLVKNSWGTTFGEEGYFKLERDDKDGPGKCGIQMKASYPTPPAATAEF